MLNTKYLHHFKWKPYDILDLWPIGYCNKSFTADMLPINFDDSKIFVLCCI